MPKPALGRINNPLSLNHIGKFTGFNSQRLAAFIPLMLADYVYIKDDFLSDTLDGTNWDLGTDGGSTAFAAGTLVNGNIRGATENASGDYILIKHARVMWDAGKNCGATIKFKHDAIVTQKYEFAFSDALTDDTLPALNDIDTPSITNGATDVVGIGCDTGQTITTPRLYTIGTTDTTAAKGAVALPALAAATYSTYTLQCGTRSGYGIVDNNLAYADSLAQGPDAAVLMKPHYVVGTLDNAVVTCDIDYIAIWQER